MKDKGLFKIALGDLRHRTIGKQSSFMPNKNCKRLVLGTAQFGLDYGINNPNGKPAIEKSIEMLECAWKNGITIFDTAESYGSAEKILGKFIKKNNLSDEIKIVSKLMPNLFSDEEKLEYVLRMIKLKIKESLERFNIKKLYGFLLHTPENIYNKNIIDSLKICKKEGLIENFGVSIYEEKDALYASELPVDFIQIPYNVFDQRLNKTDFFEICKKNKITIFARSAFLQGLIMMNKEDIPHYLEEAKTYLEKFDKTIKKYDLSRQEASLLFSYNKTGIDYVVFGIDNIEQLKEDIEIVKKNKITKDCINDISNKFLNIKRSIIFPSLWKTAAIIQARTGSTRLPNKVLLDLGGKSVLEQVITRIKESKKINKVVVATTTKKGDDKIIDICKKLNVDYFRGNENDVLDRYYQTAKKFNLSNIVRITADCPMIDPEIIDQLIDLYQRENLDYATNVIPPTFPDGLDVEIFSIKALERAWKKAKLKSAREHVTTYMWQNPNLFKQKHLNNKIDLSDKRWTLDNPEDYEFMKKVYNKLYPPNPNFRLKDLLKFFATNPEIEKINKGIKRNEGLKKSLREDQIIK